MARFVLWLRRTQEKKSKSGTLEVRTGTHALFVAMDAHHERPWVLKANHVRRWIKVHRDRLEGLARHANTPDRSRNRRRAQRRSHLQKICAKHHNRIRTFCHQATAMLVECAARCNVKEVRYNDYEISYLPEFPWHELRALLARKLEDRGIKFILASAGSDPAEEIEAA